MNTPRKKLPRWIVHLAVLALLALLHALLLPVLAHQHVVASLLGGNRNELGTLVLAAGFVILRLVVVLYLPGMVLAHLGRALYDWRMGRD